MPHTFAKDELQALVQGEVHSDDLTCTCYGVDASIFQQIPLAVVIPKSADDVVQTIRYASERDLSVTARGAGTGITGGCLGPGIIIDTSRYMNRIIEVNVEEEYVVVEPGVVQDVLNKRLADDGYRLGPDTSTGNRATLGGMLGNNSSGAHSLRYGRTIDAVLELEVALADGTLQPFGPNATGRLVEELRSAITQLEPEIRKRYPAIQRNVAGYGLNHVLEPDANVAKLFCGAEGTLGVCTRLKLAIKPKPKCTGLVVLHFDAMADGLAAVPSLLEHDPYAVELIDGMLIARGRENPSFTGGLKWLNGMPEGILVVEFDANDDGELKSQIDDCLETFKHIGYAQVPLTGVKDMAEVWALRKAGLGLLMSRRTPKRALAFIEDLAVPPDKLATFLPWIRSFFEDKGSEVGFFGHAGVGLVHVRPAIDLSENTQPEEMLAIMKTVTERVLELGGTPSGEHGDGYVRSWLLEQVYGPIISKGFKTIKDIFDPKGIMNPGKIVDATFPAKLIRPCLTQPAKPVDTAFTFSDAGGLGFAASMCNGNAACRAMEGAMCPSFQATGDEMHGTRARATAVQAAFTASSPLDALGGDDVHTIMDLCLQCKACASECPSQVDVAKMKSEALHQWQKRNGVPFRNRIFAAVDTAGKIASLTPRLANALMTSSPMTSLLSLVGITNQRPPMTYAPQRFSKWYARRKKTSGTGDKIALFVDTFSEFNYPEIPKAAVRVLEALNCDLVVPPYTCCGRPAISKGLLDKAREKARTVFDRYKPLVDAGYRIVGLEPGCILTFRDEHPSLLNDHDCQPIADASMTIEEYLFERLQAGTLELKWSESPVQILIHGHCHQKSMVGTSPATAVLRSIPGFSIEETDAGCCGMAGTFGYESEHYDLSMAIGERRLFPAIRQATKDTLIVASGASCRSQISHGAQRDGMHFIQAVAAGIAPSNS